MSRTRQRSADAWQSLNVLVGNPFQVSGSLTSSLPPSASGNGIDLPSRTPVSKPAV